MRIQEALTVIEQSQPMIEKQLEHNERVVHQFVRMLEARKARLRREDPTEYARRYRGLEVVK